MDHGLRRARAAEALARVGLDALVVKHRANVLYLTGFSGSAAMLVLGRASALLLIDGRYAEQAARESPDVERRESRSGFLEPAGETARAFGDRIGFERDRLSFGDWERLGAAAPGAELVPTDSLVEALREVKDDDERERISAAQACAEQAFDDVVLGGLREDLSERDLALGLEVAMRAAGADGLAFEPIVAFGENAAEPHHRPTERALRRGELVKTDFGAELGGYRSDMTRTVAFGEPGGRARELYAVVAAAQAAAVAAVGDGVPGGVVDAAARDVIQAADLGDAFSHPIGHGVGLEIHESPIMRSTSDASLRAGAVVTVEPGVYLPGVGGVRIEDMVEVTAHGSRVVPRTSKELIVL